MGHKNVAAFVVFLGATHLAALGCASSDSTSAGLSPTDEVLLGSEAPAPDTSGGVAPQTRRIVRAKAAKVAGNTQLARVGGGAEFEEPTNKLGSLKGIKPQEPKDLGKFVKDRAAAVALGKAFFWDMQAGSDGQACASCHFHAGADNRVKNQLSPGLNNTLGAPTSQTFNPTAGGGQGGPNYTLTSKDYPFHKLKDTSDRNSEVLFDTDDVTSSQGVFRRDFVSIDPDADGRETCTEVPDFFNVNGMNTRRNEPRNTPTMINAAFFYRSFWDGRANNVFNGVNPFGARDTGARVLELQANGTTAPVAIRLENASAASQAVGPTLSGFEMSCAGRGFADVGKKLLGLKPLGRQDVHPHDSVLGSLRDPSGTGLGTSYGALIETAFDSKYWGATDPQAGGFSQMESNFSLFWGLSIMMYESTLVSDDAPIDRYLDGDKKALTPQQIYGKGLFEGQAQCINCHHGAVISGAAFSLPDILKEELSATNSLERMAMGDGKIALYDNGFYNIGVRPTGEDLGVGGNDPWGNPLSLAREAKLKAAGRPVFDDLTYDITKFSLKRGQSPTADERDAADGCFKMPSLRNVELTGPYFHNGGQATLEQVIDFYNRGGDRRGGTIVQEEGEILTYGKDSTAFGANETNMDADVQKLFLTTDGKAAIVAFLKSFTDDRVRWEQAPFDHPGLTVANGASGDEKAIDLQICGTLNEEFLVLPAVGKDGLAPLGLAPIKGYLEK